MLNILMPKVALQRARIDSIIRQFEAASVPEHVRMDLDVAQPFQRHVSAFERTPIVVNGVPSSDTKTNGLESFSRFSLRKSLNSLPVSGCVAGVPRFTRRMWIAALWKLIWFHCKSQSSETLKPCR